MMERRKLIQEYLLEISKFELIKNSMLFINFLSILPNVNYSQILRKTNNKKIELLQNSDTNSNNCITKMQNSSNY